MTQGRDRRLHRGHVTVYISHQHDQVYLAKVHDQLIAAGGAEREPVPDEAYYEVLLMPLPPILDSVWTIR